MKPGGLLGLHIFLLLHVSKDIAANVYISM